MKLSIPALLFASILLLQAAPGGEKGPRPDKANHAALEAFMKNHPEIAEKLKDMTPEQRREWLKDHPEVREKIKERLENLTPEQKEKMREVLKEKAEKLTPEQKEKLKERFDNLSPDKKAKLKERLEAKLKDMTPEEKDKFLAEHPAAKDLLK